MSIYTGFSTVSGDAQKKFILTDKKLIIQDLMNVFNTKRGSRVMNPNYGCIIWEKLFENITTSDVQDIAANMTSIVNADPRVVLVSIDITQNHNTITITLIIQYVGTDETEQLILNFNNEISA